MRPVAVIPARYASVRFPGKPLAALAGKPMIEHVWDRCRDSGAFAEIIIATDDDRIAEAVARFGGSVARTSPECPSGTDRVAEVARARPDVELFVNVQGDEPLIDPDALALLPSAFADPTVEMATLVRPLEEAERGNPNVVKAVLARTGDALYFSRADLPFPRDGSATATARYGHLGLYGYRRPTLLRLAELPPTPLEEVEKLEQLRALEYGIKIRCLHTDFKGLGVDTPADLARAEEAVRRSGLPRRGR